MSANTSSAAAIQDTLFTHAKAGMDDVDREKIKRLVYEYSKGSAFLAEQERRDRRVAHSADRRAETLSGSAAPSRHRGSDVTS